MSQIDQRKNIVIYDLESYKDFFVIGMREYSRKTADSEYIKGYTNFFYCNDEQKFIKYFNHQKSIGSLFVAYNNQSYDDLMISRFMNPNILKATTDQDMRKLNDLIINNSVIGKQSQHITPEGMFYVSGGKLRQSKKSRKQIFGDDYKCCDLFNLTGDGSLKMKAIVLMVDSIMESPLSFNDLVGNRTDEVIAYLESDLDQTFMLYQHVENDLKVRDGFYDKLPDIAYLVNSPQLGDEYFRINTKEFESLKKKWFGKTIRASDCMMNKQITFNNPILKDWYTRFNETKLHFADEFPNGKPTRYSDESINAIDIGIYNHQITFGLGGLHSTNKNGYHSCSEDEIMVEKDCSGMYPTAIVNYGINPAHIPSFSKTVAENVIKRNEFKDLAEAEPDNKQHSVASDGFKLINNSVFGKLQDRYSYVFDMKALYQVTITNQILLLKLIDMLITSGLDYTLIQVNTDAVVIKYKRSINDQIIKIMHDWEVLSKHNLGTTEYTSLHQMSVNNYFAVKPNGKMKTKGDFVLEPRINQKLPTAKIVKLACIDYLRFGIDPMDTITNSRNVTDFIISANSTDFESAGKEIGYKAIRVVYSESGDAFTALKNDNVNGGYKRSVVLEDEKLKFLIKLSDHSVDNLDLNYDRYAWDAWMMIWNVIKPENDNDGDYFIPKKQPEYSWKHIKLGIRLYKSGLVGQWYKYLTALGLSVMPKSICKCNYKGCRTKHPETWTHIDPAKALGLAVVCSNVVSIDIDNPAKLDPKLRELLIKYPTMKIWHGVDRVLNGGKGAFIFKGIPKLKSNTKLVESHGFEFFADDAKVQTVFGVHPKNELYQISGTLIDLPAEIEQYLMDLKTTDGKRAIGRITGKRETITEYVNTDEINVDLVLEKLTNEGIVIKQHKFDNGSLHIWDNASHWFVIGLRNDGTYSCNTNHATFSGYITEIVNKLHLL